MKSILQRFSLLLIAVIFNVSVNAEDDVRPVIGEKITISGIPNMTQIRRVPTGRSFDGPGQDWTTTTGPLTISMPTTATYREYKDVTVTLSEEEICDRLQRNHGYSNDGDGWYWLDFHIGEHGPYKLAYRRDHDFSRWFVEALVKCARQGGGTWSITVGSLRRDAKGTHWYIPKTK